MTNDPDPHPKNVIKFGTDGWRAVVGEDFNYDNVKKAIKAIAKYVYDTDGPEKTFLIGYDPRNMAKEFAYFSAGILAELGFDVLISNEVVPTPVVAYSAKLFAANAIMFTASHNPPEYLGIKFIPDYAGPATSEITNAITNNLEIADDFSFTSGKKGEFKEKSFKNRYFEHIEELIDFKKIAQANIQVIYDGLYSASIGYFDKLLERNGINCEKLHMEHDPNFGGGMPEPKARFLCDLIDEISQRTNAIGLSNDGDGDRFGVINEKAEYVSPNEIIALLLRHLIKNKKMSGKLVKTVGASRMLDIIAEKYDVDVIETPVGFKWVGKAMRENDVLIGGEESGGLSIKGHIPEKDGILADLLVLEMLAYENRHLWELQEDLKHETGCEFFNKRLDLKLSSQDELKTLMDKYSSLEKIGYYQVISSDKKDGIRYFLDEKTRILIRPSGTEPLLRIYFESDSKDKIDELIDFFK